jgi:ribose 5-phosphate isomerase
MAKAEKKAAAAEEKAAEDTVTQIMAILSGSTHETVIAALRKAETQEEFRRIVVENIDPSTEIGQQVHRALGD